MRLRQHKIIKYLLRLKNKTHLTNFICKFQYNILYFVIMFCSVLLFFFCISSLRIYWSRKSFVNFLDIFQQEFFVHLFCLRVMLIFVITNWFLFFFYYIFFDIPSCNVNLDFVVFYLVVSCIFSYLGISVLWCCFTRFIRHACFCININITDARSNNVWYRSSCVS